MRLNDYEQNYSPTTMRTKKYGEGEAVSDDIVTRLRGKYQGQLPICIEAADEIERLRVQLDNLKAENQRLSQIANYQ